MKRAPSSAFVTIPALLFLLVAASLLFLRPKQHSAPHPSWTQAVDTTASSSGLRDSLAQLPDSLNPFIQLVDLDAVTDRVKAVQQCGTCHQRAYENWSDGPHAASYKSIRKLYETASDTVQGYFPKQYGKWIHANMKICFQCHVTENLYETNFKGIPAEQDLAQIQDSLYPLLHAMGKPRTDPKTFTTGVDCFTCHYDGERVITGPNFKPDPSKAGMPGYCNPLPTAFFTTNTNCVTCHNFAHDTQEANLAKGMTFEETNCIRCHQTYDAHGKGTHYYNWRFADAQRHPQKYVKGGLFESLNIMVQKGQHPKLVLDWANTLSLHGLSECGEIVLEIQVLDQNGAEALKQELRLNRKVEHDVHLREQLNGEEPTGILGYAFDPSDPPIHEEYALSRPNIKGGKILLRAIDKAQYWASDAIGVEVYRKEIVF